VSLLIASLFIAFIYYRNHAPFSTASTTDNKTSHADSLRLYSDGILKPPPCIGPSNPSSEFLYLGTLANSNGIDNGEAENLSNARVSAPTQNQKLGSLELKALLPLPKSSFKQSYGSSAVGSSGNEEDDEGDEEEFFSPRGSSGRKESPVHTGSSFRRVFNDEKFRK
jgi:hypothetical protein